MDRRLHGQVIQFLYRGRRAICVHVPFQAVDLRRSAGQDEDPPSVIPINTVLFRSQGNQVAIVDDSNIVHLKAVTVGRDFGTSYEITDGVSTSDRLVLNPSDSLADGEKVLAQEAPAGKLAK